MSESYDGKDSKRHTAAAAAWLVLTAAMPQSPATMPESEALAGNWRAVRLRCFAFADAILTAIESCDQKDSSG